VSLEEGGVVRVSPDFDCAGTQYSNFTRSWFHFQVTAPVQTTLTFIVEGVYILLSWLGRQDNCRPVIYEDGAWQRFKGNTNYVRKEHRLELSFSHHFKSPEAVSFALTYPFSYLDNLNLLDCI
jgi:hypothetical protein